MPCFRASPLNVKRLCSQYFQFSHSLPSLRKFKRALSRIFANIFRLMLAKFSSAKLGKQNNGTSNFCT